MFVYCDFFEIFGWYILSYVEQNSPTFTVKPSIKNQDPGKVSSIFVSDTISVSRFLPTYFTSDSNLFLSEFMLI